MSFYNPPGALGVATATSLAIGGAPLGTFTLAVSGNTQIGYGGGSLFFTNASRIDDLNGSGLFRMFNAGASSGIGLGVTTNGVLAVRTSNNGADGGITAATLALGGATIGTNVLAVTGAASIFGDANNWIQIRNNGGNYQIITNWSSGGGNPLNLGAGANHWSIATTGTLSSSSGTGAIQSTSLALGGATIGSNALAVTGTAAVSTSVSSPIFYNAAAGGILFGAQSTTNFFCLNNWAAGGTLQGRAGSVIGWGASTTNPDAAAPDTGLSRIAAGIIGVGTGAAGNVAGGLQAATLALGGATIGANALAVTGTGAFSGAVSLGNTVNSVSPTSPNRTVTMVIGGTTYYLAAKTTND